MIILRNKEFARKDYDGLSETQRKAKLEERTRLARDIRKMRVYDKSLMNEIDKIAKEDTRKYVLNGEGKNREMSPEQIERRRKRRIERLYEPSRENKDKILEYLEKGKQEIEDRFKKENIIPDPEEVVDKAGKKGDKKLLKGKLGKIILGSTIAGLGIYGGTKAYKSRRNKEKLEEAKSKTLGNK